LTTEKNSEGCQILLKNLGFSPLFFDVFCHKRNEQEESATFVIRREKIRKVGSENAVVKIERSDVQLNRCREEEDLEAYKEMEEHEYFGRKDEGDHFRRVYEDSNLYGQDEYPEEEENCNQQPAEERHFDLDVFANCSRTQMSQLNRIVTGINSAQEEKVLVKAYRSKLKSKFYRIYEENSQQYREKIKYKIFHKCNFPSCGRTFASAGWLKSHFQEHLHELKKNKFNILFDSLILDSKKNYFN
jgi:hypothetical protein